MTDPKKLSAIIKVLTKAWTPHSGQVEVGTSVFQSLADMIYVECGRKFGKTELAVYLCWMYAATRPNAEVYYLAPLVKQAKELVWSNNRMQTCNTYADWFLPAMEKAMGGPIKILGQEGRVILPNGSFIKVDGSDNVEAQRGLKPDFVACDEYRDFKARWIEAVRPNMLVKKGKMLFITTPPHSPNHAYELACECSDNQNEGSPHYFYLNKPTFTNDRIPDLGVWLEREKARLYKLGRSNEWLREYMAQFILDNEHAVLPQLNSSKLEPHDGIMRSIREAGQDIRWSLALNPGNSTVFGALLCAYNTKTNELFCVDCIKEWESDKASIRKAGNKVLDLCKEYDLSFLSDGEDNENDARALVAITNPRYPWLSRDLYECHRIPSGTANDEAKHPEYNVNLIKDISISGLLRISDRCRALTREAEQYVRSEETFRMQGARTVELQTLLIDCLKYCIDDFGYTFDIIPEPARLTDVEEFEQRLREQNQQYDVDPDDLGRMWGF